MPSKSFVKFIGLLLLLSLGPLSIYFLYTRTGGLESRRELAFHRTLRFAFMGGTDVIGLAPLTNWPWERVCAFKSGLSQGQINDLVGFIYDDFAQLPWRDLEDYWTLMFIDAERETNWGMHRPVISLRIPMDTIAQYAYTPDSSGLCVIKDNAVLALTREAGLLDSTPVTARLTTRDELLSQ